MFTKTAAARILKGLALKVEQVRVLRGVVQVTYLTAKGRCSTFISKAKFEADFKAFRIQGASSLTIEPGINAWIVRNPNKGSAYQVTDDFGFECGCEDYKAHGLPCKHVYRVFVEINSGFCLRSLVA